MHSLHIVISKSRVFTQEKKITILFHKQNTKLITTANKSKAKKKKLCVSSEKYVHQMKAQNLPKEINT